MRRAIGTFLLGIGTLLKTAFTIFLVAAVAIGTWIPVGKAIEADPSSARWVLIPFALFIMGLTWWIAGLAYSIIIALPMSLLTTWLIGTQRSPGTPRQKQPTAEQLYYEVWRLGQEQAQRAIINYYASPDGAVAEGNPSLERIVRTAVNTSTDVQRILERRARLAGVFETMNADVRTVRRLAEALALDPDEALQAATRRLADPSALLYE